MDVLTKLAADIGSLWQQYHGMYLRGMLNTLLLALAATAVGCVIGLLCGVLNTIPYTKKDNIVKRFFLKFLRIIIRIYVEVFRGTPDGASGGFLLLRASVFHEFWRAFRQHVGGGTACCFGKYGAYMAESVRGGIISIDPGQTEGAKAIGMNHFQTMLHVIIPQALRNIMPQIGNNYIINVKDTSVMFIIGFTEFFATHKYIVGFNNKYFPSAVIEMAGYLLMTLTASFILRFIEKKMDGGDNYELVQTDALTMTAGTYSHPSKGSNFDERNTEIDEVIRSREEDER